MTLCPLRVSGGPPTRTACFDVATPIQGERLGFGLLGGTCAFQF